MSKNNFKCLSVALALLTSVASLSFAGCKKEAASKFETPTYQVNALKFEEMGNYESEVVDGSNSHQGSLENGMIISPYLTCKINGTDVPVYGARCTGGAHSFSYVYVEDAEKVNLKVELELCKTRKKVVVLPESRGVTAQMEGRSVKATVKSTGSFSFAFDDKVDRGYTLIVKQRETLSVPDGWTEQVIEPGTYTSEQTAFTEQNKVYRFKSGKYDLSKVTSAENSILYFEPGTYDISDINLLSDSTLFADYAYFRINNKVSGSSLESNGTTNVKVLGKSVFDYSAIDMNKDSKSVVNFNGVENFTFSGVTIINSCSWTYCFTRCLKGKITDLNGFSYRTFSDGVMLANCHEVKVTDSFMRTGDDAFEVKSTSTGEGYDIEFSDCHAWNEKAVAFGVIYEMNYVVHDVKFVDCSVGFNMPTWDVTRAAASICMCDYEKGNTNYNINFENFEIYYSKCPAISICLHSGTVRDIYFKNFTVTKNYTEFPVYFRFVNAYIGGSPTENQLCRIQSIYLDNIKVEGKALELAGIKNSKLAEKLYLDGTLHKGD